MKSTYKNILGALPLLSLGMVGLAGTPATAQSPINTGPATGYVDYQEEFAQRVYEAILANPQIVFEAIDIAREQEAAEKAAERKDLIQKLSPMLVEDPNAIVLGNPDGDVTVVEFYDYNCPYCKKASPEVKALIAADENVRVVMREFPVLGPTSDEAARVALASHAQGRFEDVHHALMDHKERLKEGDALRIAEDLGLNMGLLEQDMEVEDIDRHIDISKEIARILGINGTPSFVIGTEIVPGLADVDRLQGLVDAVRDGNKE